MHIYTLPPYIYIYIYMLVGRIDATAGAEKDVYIYMSTEEGSIYICIYIFRDEESMRQQLLGRVLSKEAYTRLGNVQSVDPKRVRVIEDKIIAMARSG